ncbi:hypothetical protein TNCV_3378111 [Trichonephila clavipes]|nr:hypothetical protein TNCV_3378111 [Trichonephila clavipes]
MSVPLSRAGQGRLSLSSLQWVDKLPILLRDLTLGVSLQTNHLIGTSAHTPQRPMVTYAEMGTGLGPHGLLRH